MTDEIIEEFRPSWTAWFWHLLLSLGLALPYVWWQRRGVRYEITDSRVIRHTGRITSSTDEFRLDRVTRIRTHQSLVERLFGVGTITLDAGVDEITLRAVPNCERVAESIRRSQE